MQSDINQLKVSIEDQTKLMKEILKRLPAKTEDVSEVSGSSRKSGKSAKSPRRRYTNHEIRFDNLKIGLGHISESSDEK